MSNISYSTVKSINSIELAALYEDAGWTSYVNDIPTLQRALEASLMTITAWDQNQLVGLIRVVGDGLTIIYIQDILVKKTHKRNGIGTTFLNLVMDQYKNVRQKVLLTEDTEETRKFYEANAFVSCDKGVLVAFAKLI